MAAWTFEPDRPGKYAVWLVWACADGTEGNAYVVEVGGERIAGKVASTGSWDNYRQAKIGEVNLSAGTHRMLVRSEGRIRGALLDLKALELRPIATSATPARCWELP
jgi:hypothetical protein